MEFAKFITQVIYDKKGIDIIIKEMSHVSLICDYFIIASAETAIATKAIADEVEKKVKDKYKKFITKSGYDNGSWILLDYNDVVVHIFTEETRAYYDLEGFWEKAPTVDF